MLEIGKKATVSKDLIYGPEGVGKSSLGCTYPSPLFLDCEGSTTKLDVARIRVHNWNDFIEATNMLILNEEPVKDFETVIIDTADWLEKIAIDKILEEDGVPNMNDKLYTYGKDSVRIKGFFETSITPVFEKIMATGRNIVIIAHSVVKGFDDPILGRYDYYGIDMNKKASAILRQWVNNVFFINYKTYIKEGKGIDKDRAIGGTEVVLHTKKSAQYEAKRRDDLDDVITFEENECPYPEIIGTTVIKAEQIAKIKACKTEGELIKLWASSFIFQKKTWFESEFKAHTVKVRESVSK